jgi:hypothetical protein
VKHLVEQDCGLGTAYERYCFYQLLDAWAASFGVESLLEGPVDGMAGVAGVHGVGLARRGVKVVSAVPTEEHARVARAVYATSGAAADVTVLAGDDAASMASLPRSDMVLSYHALSFVDDWRAHLKAAAALARKVLVVTVCNPDNWGVSVVRAIARLRGIRDLDAPESWQTDVLAPELWKHGRVREHTYFDCPWWPDLQVSPGQSLTDRLRKMTSRRFQFTDTPEDSKLAERFVYGDGRWPYFGGAGWVDELMPALLKHPCLEGARSTRVRRRSAHLHAFVVDMRPRTARQRRSLAQIDDPKVPVP